MRDQQGFTLIELLVAMAVFCFVLLIIVVGFMNIVNIHNAALASNQAQDSVRAAMDEMVQAVRDSTGVQWIKTGVAPGMIGGSNYDVICLDNASGGPKEYFVRPLPGGGNSQQLWVRNGLCTTTALNNPPAATDVPLTSSDEQVQYFKVQQVPDPSLGGVPAGWKPQVQITMKLGSYSTSSLLSGSGAGTHCNNNAADRAFCSTAELTSGAAPR